jgi:subtilisin family serine protease
MRNHQEHKLWLNCFLTFCWLPSQEEISMVLRKILSCRRPKPQGFGYSPETQSKSLQALILEPILTPSGLVDGFEEAPPPVDIELPSAFETETDFPAVDSFAEVVAPEPLEDLDFITDLDPDIDADLEPSPFDSGVFTVGDDGQVSIDFLFDGGKYEGELALFSLDGMDQYEPGSEAFIQEAASRALSDSELGHVVISDRTEGARFDGELGERNWNRGDYISADDKVFTMRAGDEFGLMLVPKGTVQQVFDNPDIGGATRPLFSMATANPDDAFHVGQIADVTGDGNTFVFEDMRVDGSSDQDYNDLIFQIKGATGDAVDLDQVIDAEADWRESRLGQDLIGHAEETVFETLVENLDISLDGIAEAVEADVDVDLINFSGEFETVTNVPDRLLEWETPNLSESFTNSLDGVTDLLDAEIDALPDQSDAYFEDVVIEALPDNVATAFTHLEDATLEQLSEQTAALNTSEQDLQQTIDDLNSDFSDVDGALDEITELLRASMDEVPDELMAEINAFKALMAEAGPELIAALGVGTLTNEVNGLLTTADTAWDEDEDESLSSPIYVGDPELPESEHTVDLEQFEFAAPNQPLIGVIDTGFAANNPDLDYSRFEFGSDYVEDDDNPLLQPGEGDEHGTHILGIIAATQGNTIGTEGINDEAPVWLSRAVESGKWANALVDYTNAFIASGQPNGVINLSFDLVQTNPDGSESARHTLTEAEQAALAYAQQAGVLVVVAAGNDGEIPSALGQASQTFDNLITVGAVGLSEAGVEAAIHNATSLENLNRADYSNYGNSIDLVAAGGSEADPVYSTVEGGLGIMSGTSVAAAKVTGAASLVWAANPALTYQQVIHILKTTADDLAANGWDTDTGAGLLNISAAVNLALVTTADVTKSSSVETPPKLSGDVTPEFYERPAGWFRRKLKKAFKKVGKVFKKASKAIGRGVRRFAGRVRSGFKRFGRKLGKFIRRLPKRIFSTVKRIGSYIGRGIRRATRFTKKVFSHVWNGVKWVARRTWYHLRGVYYRTVHWMRQLPKRVARVVQGLWSAVKSFKPWAISWWKSLGRARTWKDFLNWLTRNLVSIGELVGVREIYDTFQDLVRFKSRFLTSEERVWAKSVFGSAIDYNVVRLIQDSKLVNDGANATNKLNLIAFPEGQDINDHIFIHEMTHVWQYQSNNFYDNRAIGSGEYAYGGLPRLRELKDAGKGLLDSDLGREGQAEIVQDYYILKTGRSTQELNGKPLPDGGGVSYATSPKDLPLFVHFVKEASSLSEAQLMGVGDQSPRAPHLFQSAYDSVNGFDQGIYPVLPQQGVYRLDDSLVQDFSTQDDKLMRIVLEDGSNTAYWVDLSELKHVTVNALSEGFDTGIELKQGEPITLFAEGGWSNVGNNQGGIGLISAEGYPGYYRPSATYPHFPFASLVGTVGGRSFKIGKDFDGMAPASGRLFLQMNDDPGTFGDNSGALAVTIAKPVDVPVLPVERFWGDWTNVDPNTRGTTRVEITKGAGDSIQVHTWGKCYPTDCDHGIFTTQFKGNPTTVVQEFGFKTATLTITENAGELKIVGDHKFHDGTNRDYVSEHKFKRS